jgi:hypothetical protein
MVAHALVSRRPRELGTLQKLYTSAPHSLTFYNDFCATIPPVVAFRGTDGYHLYDVGCYLVNRY